MSVAMTIQIDEAIKARLDVTAAERGVSAEEVAADLVQSGAQLVELTGWQEAEVRAAMSEVDLEGAVPGAQALEWLQSLETRSESPLPAARLRTAGK